MPTACQSAGGLGSLPLSSRRMPPQRRTKVKARRIRRFWARGLKFLKWYSRNSAAWQFHLGYREGFYLIGAFIVLLALVWAAIRFPVESTLYVCAAVALYYIADSLVVNTWITFVSRSPLVPIRSMLLTLLNLVNITLAFAVLYAGQADSFKDQRLTFGTAIYFSVVTITTVGYGDIVPVHRWAKITAIGELAVGLYFLAAVLSMVVQWNQRQGKRRR